MRAVTGSSAAGERRMEIRRMVIGRLRDLALIPALVVMGAVFSLTTSDFLTQQNLLNILQQNAVDISAMFDVSAPTSISTLPGPSARARISAPS